MFRINHIHLKAPDPLKTAQWYVDMFGAKIVGEGQGLGGSQTVRLDIEGTRINVTSAPAGQSLPQGTAESHYGLEHFGFDTDDIVRCDGPHGVPGSRRVAAHHSGSLRQ